MKAIRVENGGDDLVWTEVDDPTPGEGEVLVEVHASAVNRADLLQRRGLYDPPPGESDILGLEASGIVRSLGEGVDPKWEGRRVMCLLAGGGYAESVVVPASHLLPIPDRLSFVEAAAIPEVFYTAYVNLVMEAGLERGETALVHAAASGVGTAALQICRLRGARAIGTASGSKLPGLEALGADVLVDRHEEDFAEVVQSATDGVGVDVILDLVGADYLEQNLNSLRVGGRMVLVGLLSGAKAEIDLRTMLRRRVRLIGSVLRARSRAEKAEITRRFIEDVWPAIDEGRIEPQMHDVVPVAEAARAHQMLANNETVGKVVLAVR